MLYNARQQLTGTMDTIPFQHCDDNIAKVLIENSFSWVLWHSPDGTIRYSSPSCKAITGYNPEEFLHDKQLISRIALEEDLARFKDHTTEVLTHQRTGDITFRIRRSDGSIRWIRHQCRPLYDEHGTFLGTRSDNTDITDQRFLHTMLQSQYDLGQALVSARSLNETLDICLSAAIKISSLDCGGVYLLDPITGNLDLECHRGLPDSFLAQATHYTAGDPHIAFIMNGKPTYAAHLHSAIPVEIRVPEERLRALAVVPFSFEGDVIGCLNVASHTLDVVPEEARASLETVATQIGGAIARARLADGIRQERTNLHVLFNTIKDFLFILDEHANIVFTNPVVTERLGYDEADLKGVSVLLVHPPELRSQAAMIVADMLAGKLDVCPLSLLTKDGQHIPVETRVVRGAWNGRPAIFGISRDITERHRAEMEVQQLLKEKNILLHEVHHRIKNNMTLITSLLSLQASSTTDQFAYQALKEAESRVRAMVDIYEKLYRETDYRSIGLRSYFTSLVNDLARNYTLSDRIAIAHEIDDCLLDTKIVFPLGIIVTELVTNALKYAFPDDRTGKIRIRVKIQDEHRIIMTVTDNGIGIAEERLEEEKRGFGLQLVHLLAQQISSTVTMLGTEGTVITLSVPIPESTLSES